MATSDYCCFYYVLPYKGFVPDPSRKTGRYKHRDSVEGSNDALPQEKEISMGWAYSTHREVITAWILMVYREAKI
jgi:hypothetical protein